MVVDRRRTENHNKITVICQTTGDRLSRYFYSSQCNTESNDQQAAAISGNQDIDIRASALCLRRTRREWGQDVTRFDCLVSGSANRARNFDRRREAEVGQAGWQLRFFLHTATARSKRTYATCFSSLANLFYGQTTVLHVTAILSC